MRTKIKSIRLQNFKGCIDKTYEFCTKNGTVCGQNGSGKTTIATAFYWVFADKDYDLHSNPAIRPINAEEVTPRVEIVLDVDGREVSVAKFQKCIIRKSRTGGADSISLSNSYEVNAVEYGERDFKQKMAEYNFNFELFLALAHPGVFTGQKSNDMRKVLFSMASAKSDYDIAQLVEGAGDVAKLLADYTVEEIKAMQNATLRKIREDYGKDGEVLRAKIEGLESAKTNVDVAELELLKNDLKKRISDNLLMQDDVSKQFAASKEITDGILELRFKASDIERKANEELLNRHREVNQKIDALKRERDNLKFSIMRHEKDLESNNKSLICQQNTLLEKRNEWKMAKERLFDENSLICTYCGQEYPLDKKEQIKADFENNREKELASITAQGNTLSASIKRIKEEISTTEELLLKEEEQLPVLEQKISNLALEESALPMEIDLSGNEEYQSINVQIAQKELQLKAENNTDAIRQQLRDEESDLRGQLAGVETKIALFAKNIEIDERIAELRSKQLSYEQQIADCEKILDQLNLLGKRKNELLTEDINKHFEIVRWQMFEYQKNGEYKECCVPRIDDRRFGESTNTGREILAMLDIIKGLQKFYGQYYPVFLDGAECLSEETKKRINMDCQLIYLAVSEDKETKIKLED